MNLNRFMVNKTQPMEKLQIDPPTSCNSFAELPDGHIPEGRRNTVMSHIAGRLVKRYGDTHEARGIFLEKAKSCVPPLDEHELDSIWSSAVKFGKAVSAQPGYVPPEEYNDPTPCKPDDYSDVGQAYAFAKHCRNYVRYSPATDYIVYDGVCWQESKPRSQAAMQQFTDTQLAEAEAWLARTEERLEETGAKAVIVAHGKNASEFMTEEQKAAFFAQRGAVAYRKFVLQRRDSKYQVAALREARPMVEIGHGELDKDGFLLNTPEYTVDLRKGMNGKQEHSAEDFITKCTAVSPGSRGADLWKDALHTFFCGDAELKEYVQRIAGLALIGHVYIEALIIAHGDGRNGKSTFWNVLARVMGSYSGNISADALTVGCKRNVKPELAETKGKRLLIAAELEEGMRLNTSIVKQFCSTDEIFAEKKYKDPFAFTPTHTLVLYTNHLPKVGANDPGTWRRLIVVPFNARIDGSGDVKNYADYLFDNSGPAVLAWMIEGAEKVISDNFRITQPECVKKATALYRENSDWLTHFLEECCEVGDTYSEHSGDLYAAYRSFCGRSGEWSIFENTHEPIIDQETFDIVQRIRDGRRRLTPIGEMPILSGMLFCADCGAKLYQVRARGWKHEQEYFTCASYRKGQGLCSPHQIHNVQVEEILLRQLKSITAYARSHETEFVELVTRQNEKELNHLMRSSNKELVQAKERIKKLDSIMQRLYEDNIDGKISDDRFSRMSATYETEQKQLETRASELEAAIAEAREQRLNVDSFLGMVRRYTDISELTAEIIRSFVEKIDVKKPEKVPGTRTKKQTLVIWWNFIGVVDIPQQEQKETA